VKRNAHFVGIDGCKGGWCCVQLGGEGQSDVLVCATDAINGLARIAKSILIDIPIGLVDAQVNERVCDKEARSALGPKRASSVFSVPARQTLSANNYKRALAINRRIVGRGISVQAWAIAPKIRAIDDLIQDNEALRRKMRESHPEVCFWALNGARPMRYNKACADGRAERMSLLRRFLPTADVVFDYAAKKYLRKKVARDDIIDAMVLAVTAQLGDGNYRTFPARPPRDAFGLPMQICFHAR
jgi:predicted RNase H-like nuclease